MPFNKHSHLLFNYLLNYLQLSKKTLDIISGIILSLNMIDNERIVTQEQGLKLVMEILCLFSFQQNYTKL